MHNEKRQSGAEKNIDRIIVEKGRRGDFSRPCSPIVISGFL